jgi:hypothetical protein
VDHDHTPHLGNTPPTCATAKLLCLSMGSDAMPPRAVPCENEIDPEEAFGPNPNHCTAAPMHQYPLHSLLARADAIGR